MKKALALAQVAIAAVVVAIWQPALGWISPATYVLILPVCAFWFWRSEGRTLADLGLRRGGFWRQSLGWGILLGVLIPIFLMAVQVLLGWVVLTPSVFAYANLPPAILIPGYIAYTLIKMLFIVAIEEFVFRGYFLQRFSVGMGAAWAVVLSSALWAGGHLVSMTGQGLSTFSIAMGMLTFITWGIALSQGCYRSGKSLWFPFGVHYGVNFSFSMLGAFCLVSYHAPQWLVGNPNWAPESGVLGILLWLAAIGAVWMITAPARVGQK